NGPAEMDFIIILGPPAVGKMTAGQELERLTGFKLVYNHVAMGLVAPYLSYGSPQGRRLVGKVRQAFFDAVAADPGRGYIFTFVWAFGEPGDRAVIEGVAAQFASSGHDVFWVELGAMLTERLTRNRGENSLVHKPTKRDLEWSDQHIRDMQKTYRFNSAAGDLSYDNYVRVDNTHLSALDVAEQICQSFGFAPHEAT
ncbi:MAG: AAA family ATPase, partial [Pseudomonadota bacterium]